jgi:beta-lactamase regulating signal transducer with metallopeptidase domain
MMALLVPFALKSLLIAGLTLGLLHLLRDRSASERNMIAHFGLLALMIMPLGSMFLPQLVVSAPILAPAPPITPVLAASSVDAAPLTTASPRLADAASLSLSDLWPLLYGFPAAALLAMTLLAVLRLLTLRARASVLVEPSWINALAHAQRRMGFKHGTALLSSNDLKSPISWGVLRPVILVNDEAIAAHGEAEAIIAHELAHVRGLDWAKLLLARIVTAIFWFNPLVWLLAREAHHLREETADDAVLAANIVNTDYAQLLVGVARHECKGILLASHGVAPGRNSLSRRVRRVLDSTLPRTPVARGFAAGMMLGVVGAAAPLAALTLTPRAAQPDTSKPYYVSAPRAAESLPAIVASSVAEATTITGHVVSTQVSAALAGQHADQARVEADRALADAKRQLAVAAPARMAVAATAASAVHPQHQADNEDDGIDAEIDRAVARAVAGRAMGADGDYAARIRAAAPQLRFDGGELAGLKAVGVTPEWLRAMLKAGYQARDVGDLTGARAVGVSPTYVAELAREGYRGIPLDDLTSMRALGVDASYIRRLRSLGRTNLSPSQLVELRALGVGAASRGRSVRPVSPVLPAWIKTRDGRPPGVPRPPEPDDPDITDDHDPDPDPDR